MFPLCFGRGDGTCKEPRSGDGIAIGAKAAGKSGRRGADRVSHDLSAAAEKRRGFSRKLIMQNGAETKMFPLRFGRGDGT